VAKNTSEQINWQNKVARAILILGAIRYVPLSLEDGFFIIKYSGSFLEANQQVLVNENYMFSESHNGLRNSRPLGTIAYFFPRNFCFIFHNGSLIERSRSGKRGFRGDVEKYLSKYYEEYNKAPEFHLETFFTAQLIQASGNSLDDNSVSKEKVVTVPNRLIPRNGLKISSQAHWKHISKLLRDVGLLKENRGKLKSIDSTIKNLKLFVIKEFKSMSPKNKKSLPIAFLKKRLEAKVDSLYPNSIDEAKKYYRGDSTIRRWITSIKK